MSEFPQFNFDALLKAAADSAAPSAWWATDGIAEAHEESHESGACSWCISSRSSRRLIVQFTRIQFQSNLYYIFLLFRISFQSPSAAASSPVSSLRRPICARRDTLSSSVTRSSSACGRASPRWPISSSERLTRLTFAECEKRPDQ